MSITLYHVTKKYANGHIALEDICLKIETGEMVFLQGHSGAGKSTLLKIIALLERPSRGQVVVGSENIHRLKNAQIPFYRRRIGFISQHPKLLSNLSVFHNIAMPLRIADYTRAEIQRRVHAALDRVDLFDKQKAKPCELSEGEKQRVGIARGIVHKPCLVLADEPTGNLDPELSLEIMGLFERFHQAGVTVLIASHDASLVAQLGHRTIHLSKGQLINTTSQHSERVMDEEWEYA